jgi:hypothetical protein
LRTKFNLVTLLFEKEDVISRIIVGYCLYQVLGKGRLRRIPVSAYRVYIMKIIGGIPGCGKSELRLLYVRIKLEHVENEKKNQATRLDSIWLFHYTKSVM